MVTNFKLSVTEKMTLEQDFFHQWGQCLNQYSCQSYRAQASKLFIDKLVHSLGAGIKNSHSSLHCNISLSFCSLSYNGVCYNLLKLSVSDVIVSQKGSNIFINVCVRYEGTKGRVKTLFAQNECALWYWASVRWKMNWRKYTPFYEKDTKQNQNSPVETTT